MASEVSKLISSPGSLFVVSKPKAYSSLALTNSQCAGDLISALKKSQAITDDDLDYNLHKMLYEVKGDDETVGVPLNGPKYEKTIQVPPSVAGLYHISAKFISEYAIRVSFPMSDLVTESPELGTFTVRWADTVEQLKKRIAAKYNFSFNHMTLWYGEVSMYNSQILAHLRLSTDSVVKVEIHSYIHLLWKGKNDSWPLNVGESLKKVLEEFCEFQDENPSQIRFSIVKSSSAVAENASKWLGDRTNIFAVDSAVGSWDENGLRDGDQIQVYQLNEDQPKTQISRNTRKRALGPNV